MSRRESRHQLSLMTGKGLKETGKPFTLTDIILSNILISHMWFDMTNLLLLHIFNNFAHKVIA